MCITIVRDKTWIEGPITAYKIATKTDFCPTRLGHLWNGIRGCYSFVKFSTVGDNVALVPGWRENFGFNSYKSLAGAKQALEETVEFEYRNPRWLQAGWLQARMPLVIFEVELTEIFMTGPDGTFRSSHPRQDEPIVYVSRGLKFIREVQS